jgi:hypothetical protein
MFPTTMLDQLGGPPRFRRIVEDTATMATIIVTATLQYAMAAARASLQSATLIAISEWSRDDTHHWLNYGLRIPYEYDEDWRMLSERCDVVYAVDTSA